MNNQTSEEAIGKKGTKGGWIVALLFIAFVIWTVYTASQTQVVKIGSGTATMPGMNQQLEPTITMSANMPGMNH